jgi:hypothetical protein
VIRTQLYLEDDLWNTLHRLAKSEGTTLSDLVRRAVRERYLGDLDERRRAMKAFVGTRGGTEDVDEVVRKLRRGNRMERLDQE